MRIMMFAHDGSFNRGCEAIVRSSTNIIKERMDETKVYLVSGRPESDQLITKLDGIYDGSSLSIKKYSYNWLLAALKVKFFNDESYALGVIHKNIIKHIKNVDVCLSIGGDNYCYGEQPGWYEIDRRVKEEGKKLVLWGCSIGEEDMSERKLEDLRLFDLILARETLTYNMLKNKGINNVELCADAAFVMEKEEMDFPEGWQDGNTVGLNFSPLVWNKNKESKVAVRNLINHILASTDMTIALTPHVIDGGNNDYEVLFKYYEEFKNTGRVIILSDKLNAIQYKGYIARMRFFIGARTHATIAAYSNHVPTMVLGYSVKSKGIATDLFGEEKLVLNIEEISNSQTLKNAFDEMVEEEEEIKQKLKQSIPLVKKRSYKAVDYLYDLVK
ncbi:polysaccharide pyruvyl transferase family protein [Bacillus mycoides]|uniref:polysaccharide pyruvyl transferase family protein n=1 Tax=Bacillus mycoides TaxID=1405 RepID=UPI001C009BB5|nr:polysaccharide pyruvyl transferase family protein [Bacillus mycoides]NUC17352.1 polysaccharide pyruvyl transferase family protein [Bacillus mycoides]QWG51641.1 polysaccharide pyruvyl transferase family protein [Bacillus mycoides]QWG57251.1 polysaccharide pyruvyl transferase family protein [Bacillus mycoides]QWG74953.1 polysaccharide pyruvyl transferase family protein [Bacillus mycoides]QWH24272.1 polysaccharide pyruvyl transferase family protein [Bacillus mycoides]